MSMKIRVVSLFILLVSLSASLYGQVDDPIPGRIIKRGLMVEIREIARLSDTSKVYPPDIHRAGYARVNYVRDLPDGRRFANDTRGFLYLLDSENQPSLYLNFGELFPLSHYDGLSAGFSGFTFHPEFAQNGLFYTAHVERAKDNPAIPDFIQPGFTLEDANFHFIITEWRANDPAADVFEGSRRELLRAGNAVRAARHTWNHLAFNPTSRPGDPDYGLLYTHGSDMGFANGGGPNGNDPTQVQRLDSIAGAILRIDPRSPSESGGTKGLGDYTIPPVNKFAADGDPNTLGEIFAYGFRNAQRFSWDLTDGTLYVSDIGEGSIEEINIVVEGNDYGWMTREGYFDNGLNRDGTRSQVYALPEDILSGERPDGFDYPVVAYDHNEGRSIAGGYAYHGRIPELRGKFVFGDIQRGRLFVSDLAAMKAADDGIPRTTAPIEEVQLYTTDDNGNRTYVTFRELIEARLGGGVVRADMQISQTHDGELLITSRQDGTIRMLGSE